MQMRAFATEEFDDGEGDWIGTSGGAGGEDAVRAIVNGRRAEQVEPLGAVEEPQNEEMREAFDVGKAGFELREDFEDAFGIMFGVETFGNLLGAVVGSFGASDGLWGKHR